MASQFVIISQDNCRYCEDAKAFLRHDGYEFTEFNLKDHPSLKGFIQACGKVTVPQIFDGDYWIGGYSDLMDYLRFKS